jgi:ribonuclease PH
MNVEVVYSTSLGGGSGAGDAAVGAGNDLKRAEREGSRFIRAGLLGAIDITRCPRSLLLVKVAVDFDDGNSLCAAFNASVIALMNAGIRMNYVPVAVGVAHLLVESTNMAATVFTAASKSSQDNLVEENQSTSQGEVQGKMRMLCVDPEKEEEDSVCATFQFVMRVPSAPPPQQQMEVGDDDGDDDDNSSEGKKAAVVLHTRCKGSFTQTQLAQAGALAAKAAVDVMSFFKTVDF